MRGSTIVISRWEGGILLDVAAVGGSRQKPVGVTAAPVADVTIISCHGVSGGSRSLPVSGRRSCSARPSRPLETAAVPPM